MVTDHSHAPAGCEERRCGLQELCQCAELVIDRDAQCLERLRKDGRGTEAVEPLDECPKFSSRSYRFAMPYIVVQDARKPPASSHFPKGLEDMLQFFLWRRCNQSGSRLSLSSVKAQIERRIRTECESPAWVIEMRRAHSQVGEDDVEHRQSHRRDATEVPLNTRHIPRNLRKALACFFEIQCIRIHAVEVSLCPYPSQEGLCMPSQAQCGVQDLLPFLRR